MYGGALSLGAIPKAEISRPRHSCNRAVWSTRGRNVCLVDTNYVLEWRARRRCEGSSTSACFEALFRGLVSRFKAFRGPPLECNTLEACRDSNLCDTVDFEEVEKGGEKEICALLDTNRAPCLSPSFLSCCFLWGGEVEHGPNQPGSLWLGAVESTLPLDRWRDCSTELVKWVPRVVFSAGSRCPSSKRGALQ